jgi:NADPH:quinone reductase-like Zn-dependent oxidoreductase
LTRRRFFPSDKNDREPNPDELRIRVEASGCNFADILGRVGLYPDLPPIPVVPGYEVSGRVDAAGSRVDAHADMA